MVCSIGSDMKAVEEMAVGPRFHEELTEIIRSLEIVSARLDASEEAGRSGDGLVTMALDQASHAVRRALIETRSCL